MKKFLWSITLLCGLAFTLPSCSDKDDDGGGVDNGDLPKTQKEKMDKYLSSIEEKVKWMGSISIFKDGKEIYQKNYGYSNVETKTKADATTKYRIGSMTKTFTATIIMRLIEEGKLKLDDKLSIYYPQVNKSEKITIEHMLRHQSGIRDFGESPLLEEMYNKDVSKQELLDLMVSMGSSFNPGEKTEYSNSNAILLTYIAEDISKKKYSELLEDYIIKPCGLKNTYVGEKIDPAKNEAHSYRWYDSKWNKSGEVNMSIILGSGNITSSPTDVNTFYDNLLNGKIVKESSLKQMLSFNDDGYGLGLIDYHYPEVGFFGHYGTLDAFHSAGAITSASESRVSVVILANGASYPVSDILTYALKVYLGLETPEPEFAEPTEINSEELDKYLGTYYGNDPSKITITKVENTLIIGGVAGAAIPLDYYGNDEFRADAIIAGGLLVKFYPDKGNLSVRFGGKTGTYTKQ